MNLPVEPGRLIEGPVNRGPENRGCTVLRLHDQFFVVSLPYMDNEWSGSERDLLSQHPERANLSMC